jgi:hypothetical protein
MKQWLSKQLVHIGIGLFVVTLFACIYLDITGHRQGDVLGILMEVRSYCVSVSFMVVGLCLREK